MLTRALADSATFAEKVHKLEDQKNTILQSIQQKERGKERILATDIDAPVLQEVLSEYSRVYDKIEKEEKRRLNHLIFEGITSYFKRGETTGTMEIQIRGNGVLKRTWEELKKQNQVAMVRTPGDYGSAANTGILTA